MIQPWCIAAPSTSETSGSSSPMRDTSESYKSTAYGPCRWGFVFRQYHYSPYQNQNINRPILSESSHPIRCIKETEQSVQHWRGIHRDGAHRIEGVLWLLCFNSTLSWSITTTYRWRSKHKRHRKSHHAWLCGLSS